MLAAHRAIDHSKRSSPKKIAKKSSPKKLAKQGEMLRPSVAAVKTAKEIDVSRPSVTATKKKRPTEIRLAAGVARDSGLASSRGIAYETVDDRVKSRQRILHRRVTQAVAREQCVELVPEHTAV